MANLVTSSPYIDDADDRQGRVAIESTLEEYFNIETTLNPGGKDQTVPYPDEIAHTKEGDFVVLTRDENNNVVPISASRDLRKKFEALEKKNLFRNAEAFVFNSQVNVLYFDADRMTVKISPERIFNKNYAYWAIRGIDSMSGDPTYYTGVTSGTINGDVTSHFVNTDIVNDTDGNPIGVTCSGHLILPLTHGFNYMVQFFDSDRILIDQMPFQAYSVRSMTFDTVPENAIVDVQLNSFGDTINLARGASWKDLALRVYLRYSDSTLRDVTSEWTTYGGTTGRVNISGLEDINSDEITGPDQDGFKIVVTYYLATTNIDNPLVDPDTLSISHTYTVRIVANEQKDEPLRVVPVMWTKGSGNNTQVCLKIYGVNSDGTTNTFFNDYTYKLRNKIINPEVTTEGTFSLENAEDSNKIYFFLSNVLKGNSAITTQHTFPIPFNANEEMKYTFKARHYEDSKNVSITKAVQGDGNTLDVEDVVINKVRLITGSDGVPRLVFVNPNSELSNDRYANDKFKTDHGITINKTVYTPNCIRIRNGKNPTNWHVSNPVNIDEKLFSPISGITYTQFADGSESFVDIGTPLIVEFIYRDVDSNQNVNQIITDIAEYFVNSNN